MAARSRAAEQPWLPTPAALACGAKCQTDARRCSPPKSWQPSARSPDRRKPELVLYQQRVSVLLPVATACCRRRHVRKCSTSDVRRSSRKSPLP